MRVVYAIKRAAVRTVGLGLHGELREPTRDGYANLPKVWDDISSVRVVAAVGFHTHATGIGSGEDELVIEMNEIDNSVEGGCGPGPDILPEHNSVAFELFTTVCDLTGLVVQKRGDAVIVAGPEQATHVDRHIAALPVSWSFGTRSCKDFFQHFVCHLIGWYFCQIIAILATIERVVHLQVVRSLVALGAGEGVAVVTPALAALRLPSIPPIVAVFDVTHLTPIPVIDPAVGFNLSGGSWRR